MYCTVQQNQANFSQIYFNDWSSINLVQEQRDLHEHIQAIGKSRNTRQLFSAYAYE